jgi:hypothetical protein
VELRRSANIRSSDELKAKKQGSVNLKGSGEYNSATGRRTRLSLKRKEKKRKEKEVCL